MDFTTLTQLFERGGPVMGPLLVGSVIGLAIIAERFVFFLRRRLALPRFHRKVAEQVKAGDVPAAIALAAQHRHPVAVITRTYLENLGYPDALREDILRREGSRCMEEVEAHLRGLSLIAHLAPLVGLLGTVTGLVKSFHIIEKLDGMAQPAQLAAGIWESLLTTVFGLVVAIPCLAAYHAFEQHADRIARRMQFAISEWNEMFGKTNTPAASPPTDEDNLNVVQV
jgi:biopolymer transport protein ExbB